MRLWLKDSERLPDPPPVVTDDRSALLVGIIAWLIALGLLVLFIDSIREAGNGWWLWAAIAGIALGLLGLVNVHRRHERERGAPGNNT